MTGHGKIAVITGAGSGIGRATAHALLEAGWNVVLAGRRRDMLEETAKLANVNKDGVPPRTLAVPTDIRDPAQIAGLFAAVKNTYGRIDLLFNNAGISTRGIPFEELTYEQWSDVVAVNLTGSFLCAQHAFRMMKAQDPQGGRIINNGSVSAHVPRRNSTPYVSTKHALTGLTRSISLDGREFNIACGQIDIGNAATTRNEDTARGRLQASGRVEAEARIDVRDVAKGVLYMAELPPEANVLFMTVMANKMPYVGRGSQPISPVPGSCRPGTSASCMWPITASAFPAASRHRPARSDSDRCRIAMRCGPGRSPPRLRRPAPACSADSGAHRAD
jgi:NAD(P)-dependent dehydrogenase (short-subunit alcohol dehydrogenase family)